MCIRDRDHVALAHIGEVSHHDHLVAVVLVRGGQDRIAVLLIPELDFLNKSCDRCHIALSVPGSVFVAFPVQTHSVGKFDKLAGADGHRGQGILRDHGADAVSYTHLDVYKRQLLNQCNRICGVIKSSTVYILKGLCISFT